MTIYTLNTVNATSIITTRLVSILLHVGIFLVESANQTQRDSMASGSGTASEETSRRSSYSSVGLVSILKLSR